MIEGTIGFRIVYYSKMFIQWALESLRAKKVSVEIEECQINISDMQKSLGEMNKKLHKFKKRLLHLELLMNVERQEVINAT